LHVRHRHAESPGHRRVAPQARRLPLPGFVDPEIVVRFESALFIGRKVEPKTIDSCNDLIDVVDRTGHFEHDHTLRRDPGGIVTEVDASWRPFPLTWSGLARRSAKTT